MTAAVPGCVFVTSLDADGNPVGDPVALDGVRHVDLTTPAPPPERRVASGRMLALRSFQFDMKLDAAARRVFDDMLLCLNANLADIRGTAACGSRLGYYFQEDDAYAPATDRERRFCGQALRTRGLALVDVWPGMCRVVPWSEP